MYYLKLLMKIDKVTSAKTLETYSHGTTTLKKNNSEINGLEDKLTFLKRKSTLTSESKDLLQRLNLLKKDMQKNITTENNGNEELVFS